MSGRLERLRNLKRNVVKKALTSAASSYIPTGTVTSRPCWWLHGVCAIPNAGRATATLLRSIYNDTVTRCAWSWLIGSSLTADDNAIMSLGSLHCWPMWVEGCPREHLPSTASLLIQIANRFGTEGRLCYERICETEANRGEMKHLKIMNEILVLYTAVPAGQGYVGCTPIYIGKKVVWLSQAPEGVVGRYKLVEGVFKEEEGGEWAEIKPNEDDYVTTIRNMLYLVARIHEEVTDLQSFVTVMATLPAIVNGATSDSTPKIEKHFGNIGQAYGISAHELRPYARYAYMAWPYLQALMTPPGAALGVMALLMKQGEVCIWYKILAQRMEGYGFTPLNMVISALALFPYAPWSMFFSQKEFGASDYSLETLGIKPPYTKYNKILKWCMTQSLISRETPLFTNDSTADEVSYTLIPALEELRPREDEFPELRLQGDAFLKDYERWVTDSLVMYTGIEGLSNQYPDLAYLAVQLIKKWCPGTQIGGYRGASEDRCKMLARMKRVIEAMGDLLEALSVDERLLDLTIGEKIREVIHGEGSFSPIDAEELAKLIPSLPDPKGRKEPGPSRAPQTIEDSVGTYSEGGIRID
nr:MAG: hypothetical protein [Wufeng bat jingchuvirus 1]